MDLRREKLPEQVKGEPMKLCSGKTTEGKRCNAPAGASGLCAFHDPKQARKRALGRKLGGKRNRVASDATFPAKLASPKDVRALLEAITADLTKHENSISRARVLVSVATASLETWKVGSLEDRLAALERVAEGMRK